MITTRAGRAWRIPSPPDAPLAPEHHENWAASLSRMLSHHEKISPGEELPRLARFSGEEGGNFSWRPPGDDHGQARMPLVSHQGSGQPQEYSTAAVWTPFPWMEWGTAPSPATAHLGQELIQVVTQLGTSCRSGSIKPWRSTTPLYAAIDHGSHNCTVTDLLFACLSSSHTHLIHNRPHQGPTLRTQAMKRAGDRTRTGDVQLGKLTFYH